MTVRGTFPAGLVLALLAAGAAAAAPLTREEAAARSARVKDPSYALHLDLRKGASAFRGQCRLAFTLTDAKSPLRVDLDCRILESVVANGQTLPLKEDPEGVLTLPPGALLAGANVIEITYESDFDTTGVGVHRTHDSTDQGDYIYTDFEPFHAHRMLPCFDQPDLRAPLTLEVSAPEDWKLLANMPAAAPPAPAGLTRFATSPPLPPHTYFFAAGDYHEIVDPEAAIPTRIFVRRSLTEMVEAPEIFRLTREGLAHMTKLLDEPYGFPKYDHVFAPDYSGWAMENPGGVVYHESFLFAGQTTEGERRLRAETIYHEMAHMWFGNLVSPTWWDDLWISEGLAGYLSAIVVDDLGMWKGSDVDLLTNQKLWAYREDRLATSHPITAPVLHTDLAEAHFDGITYGKSAAFFKQLAHRLGRPVFLERLARVVDAHRYRTIRSPQLIAELAGSEDPGLASWMQELVTSVGYNAISVRLDIQGGKIQDLVIEQRPDPLGGKRRTQKIDIRLYHSGPDGRLVKGAVIPVTFDGAVTSVTAARGATAPALVWPNENDEGYLRVVLDPVSLATLASGKARLDDLPARHGLWHSLSLMLEEGEIAPRDLVGIFMRVAPPEPNRSLLERWNETVRDAMDHHLGGTALDLEEPIHRLARKVLAPPGPPPGQHDLWFSMLIDSAASPAALNFLGRLLDGEETIADLPLSTQRRWKILAQLCERDAPGARERLNAAEEEGKTLLERRWALEARASLPEPATKEALWASLVDDHSSLPRLRSIAAGFHQPHQPALSRPFARRFFEAAPRMIEKHGSAYGEAFVEGLFPLTVREPEVLQMAEKLLAGPPDLPLAARKLLAERVEHLRHVLRGARSN